MQHGNDQVSIAWIKRGQGRVSAHRKGEEPETMGQTDLKTAAKIGNGLIHEQADT